MLEGCMWCASMFLELLKMILTKLTSLLSAQRDIVSRPRPKEEKQAAPGGKGTGQDLALSCPSKEAEVKGPTYLRGLGG